jgi:hypothetical protein
VSSLLTIRERQALRAMLVRQEAEAFAHWTMEEARRRAACEAVEQRRQQLVEDEEEGKWVTPTISQLVAPTMPLL